MSRTSSGPRAGLTFAAAPNRRRSAVAGALALLLGMGAACSEPTETPIAAGEAGAPAPGGPGQPPPPPTGEGGGGGSGAPDQSTLATAEGSIKLGGTVEVPGWEKGQIQIDVHTATAKRANGDAPVAVIRIAQPGPFELYLPKGTEAIQLSAILDYESNGPDANDISMDYPGNPVSLADGIPSITITINRDTTPNPNAGAASGSPAPTDPAAAGGAAAPVDPAAAGGAAAPVDPAAAGGAAPAPAPAAPTPAPGG
jgi:hypothetical protein